MEENSWPSKWLIKFVVSDGFAIEWFKIHVVSWSDVLSEREKNQWNDLMQKLA